MPDASSLNNGNKSVYIHTNGCPRRRLDCSVYTDYFKKNKYNVIKNRKNADLIVLVTCAFKKSREDECFTMIHEDQKCKGELIVLGCLPGIAPKRLKHEFKGRTLVQKKMHEIDNFFPHFKVKFKDLPDSNIPFKFKISYKEYLLMLKDFITHSRFSIAFFYKVFYLFKIVFMILSKNYEKEKIATMRIAHGCLGKCSYCAIRNATGRLRSKPLEVIMTEYMQLLDEGYRLFIFAAEDVGNYGLDIGSSLPELFSKLSEVDEGLDITWKLESIGPKWLIKYKDPIVDLIKQEKVIRLKSDFQSGNKRILKLMNRYPKLDEIVKLHELEKLNPKFQFISQFIAGFPSESDEEFQDTLELMKKLNLKMCSIFPYSDMDGTISSKLPGKVCERVIEERLRNAQSFFEQENYITILGSHQLTLIRTS